MKNKIYNVIIWRALFGNLISNDIIILRSVLLQEEVDRDFFSFLALNKIYLLLSIPVLSPELAG